MKKLLILLLFLFFSLISFSQTINCKDNDICVVEFNAGWNEANGVTWLNQLTDCGIQKISIDKGDWQSKFKIVVVPTIIIFNGEEVERFQADLSFKMATTLEEIQGIVDETLMESF